MDKAKVLQLILLSAVFFTPLIYTSSTRELFEFPKMFFIYFTALGAAAVHFWRSGGASPFHLKNTPLDRALLFFLLSYVLSTFFSLNRYTSLFGYYSRFNGGLFSALCFAALYCLFNRQLTDKRFVRATLYALFLSAFFVSLLGIAQHFGFQRDYWLQDSAARVFSTLGQPNWLAAYLVMLLPLPTALFLAAKNLKRQTVFLLITLSLYAAFWFTYSLSGLFALAAAGLIFFLLAGRNFLRQKVGKLLLLTGLCFSISFSQPGIFAPRLKSLLKQISLPLAPAVLAANNTPTSYEGDTFHIRRLVWRGGLAAWKKDAKTLLIGYGPETFAYAFLPYRPAALNMTSEWDFVYNKAHNDYVDILVTRGLVGLTSCLYLFISFRRAVQKILREKKEGEPAFLLISALSAGWAGLAASNFLGWPVVATSLLFWIFPALVFSLAQLEEKEANGLF